MENQHRKIKGYRELTQEEIDLMNDIKQIGNQMGDLIERLYEHQSSEDDDAPTVTNPEPYRWLAIGKTHIQQGLMALTRAVAKPDFF